MSSTTDLLTDYMSNLQLDIHLSQLSGRGRNLSLELDGE